MKVQKNIGRDLSLSGFRAVVIGASAGGMQAISTLLSALPKSFPIPILVVQHRPANSDSYLTHRLNQICEVQVYEAEEKDLLQAGCVYIAPANYHLLVERDQTLSLSVEKKKITHAHL